MNEKRKQWMEMLMENKAKEAAKMMQVPYRIQYEKGTSGGVFVVSINKQAANKNVFADYMSELIVGEYEEEVRFEYPEGI